MPTRTRRSSAMRRRPRRKLTWCTTDGTITFTANTQVSNTDLLLPLKIAGASVLGCTVVRTILTIKLASAVTAGDNFLYGIARLPSTALTAPVAASALIPDPSNSLDLDWSWWDHVQAAPVYDQGGTNIIHRDVRAKRRMNDLRDTYVLSFNSGATTTKPILDVSVRTLIALP